MRDGNRDTRWLRLKGLADRVDRWVRDKRQQIGSDKQTAIALGLEVATVAAVRADLEDCKRA